MRILFFMAHAGYARNFESTLRLLGERGHGVHCALDRTKVGAGGESAILERLAGEFPQLTYGPSPKLDPTRAALAKTLRLGTDYLRYLEPRYRDAPKLRERAAQRVPSALRALAGQPLVRSAPGIAALMGAFRRAERALPPDPAVVAFLRRQAPDLVLVTPLVELGSVQADYVRAARALGIRNALGVFSWDNLTNKGLMRDAPDLVAVWNEAQKQEAVELHGVPPAALVVTGASAYDHWFEWRASTTREEFCALVGLPMDRPILLYLCSSPWIAPDEASFVRRWITGIRAAEERLRDVSVLVRPHPLAGPEWQGLDLSDLGAAAVWPRGGENPADAKARSTYYDSIHHSVAVVGLNTSAQIESAIVGREVFTPLVPEYRETQEGTLHFHHLLHVNGGLLHTAPTLEEHATQLAEAIAAGGGDESEQRRRFLEAFVRPHGLGVSGTVRLVEALERLGDAAPPLPRGRLRPGPAAALILGCAARVVRDRELRLKAHRRGVVIPPRRRLGRIAAARRLLPGVAPAAATEAKAKPGKPQTAAKQKRARPRLDARPDPIDETRAAVEEALESGRPLVAGPWTSEVGFELLYWIPFLRWIAAQDPAAAKRLTVVSRGGVADWYAGIDAGYVDLLDTLTPDELLAGKRSSAAEHGGGKQKQLALSTFEREAVDRVAGRLGLDDPVILHPALVYLLYKRLAKQHAATRMAEVSRYERILAPAPGPVDEALPEDFVAVRFYFSESLPETPATRRSVGAAIASLAERTSVVLLNTGIELDDHRDFVPESDRIVRIEELLRPSDNLAVQTRVLSRARAFVGTYGGLSYLPPHLGVGSLCFYSDPGGFHRSHLDVAQRVFAEPGWGAFLALDLADARLLSLVAGALSDALAV